MRIVCGFQHALNSPVLLPQNLNARYVPQAVKLATGATAPNWLEMNGPTYQDGDVTAALVSRLA